jgi:hypothetical protein
MSDHSTSTANHKPFADTYADAAARAAATGFDRLPGGGIVPFAAVDITKLALQSDDHSIWMLVNDSPITWLRIDQAAAISPAFETLTDGATVTWAFAGDRIRNAVVTLGGNRALSITGAVNGSTGTLIVKEDGTGSRTLSLPAGSKVISTGAGAVTLSTGANKIDILTFVYDGTNYFWTIGKDYS